MNSKWFDAIFLGFRGTSNEFLVGTADGVKRVRTIRRKAEPFRWSVDNLNKFRGLP